MLVFDVTNNYISPICLISLKQKWLSLVPSVSLSARIHTLNGRHGEMETSCDHVDGRLVNESCVDGDQ